MVGTIAFEGWIDALLETLSGALAGAISIVFTVAFVVALVALATPRLLTACVSADAGLSVNRSWH